MAIGGSKSIEDLERAQKTRRARTIRDVLDASLYNFATFHCDAMLDQTGSTTALINKAL